MGNLFGMVVNIIFSLIAIIILFGIVTKLFYDRFSREKCVRAIVIDKNNFTERAASFHRPPYTREKYVVTFDCGGKRKSFYVSELSYKTYRNGEEGILRYIGSKLIDFS